MESICVGLQGGKREGNSRADYESEPQTFVNFVPET